MDWVYFPKTNKIPGFLRKTVSVFENQKKEIDSTKNDTNDLRLSSNEVLKKLENQLEELGYKVEKSKKKMDKIRITVLYGDKEREELAFEADAYSEKFKTVIEIEAGRAFTNYQFLKDIFEASMMQETEYLVLGVRKIYNKHKDYEKIKTFIEAIYLTNKIKLDLKGILLVGY